MLLHHSALHIEVVGRANQSSLTADERLGLAHHWLPPKRARMLLVRKKLMPETSLSTYQIRNDQNSPHSGQLSPERLRISTKTIPNSRMISTTQAKMGMARLEASLVLSPHSCFPRPPSCLQLFPRIRAGGVAVHFRQGIRTLRHAGLQTKSSSGLRAMGSENRHRKIYKPQNRDIHIMNSESVSCAALRIIDSHTKSSTIDDAPSQHIPSRSVLIFYFPHLLSFGSPVCSEMLDERVVHE